MIEGEVVKYDSRHYYWHSTIQGKAIKAVLIWQGKARDFSTKIIFVENPKVNDDGRSIKIHDHEFDDNLKALAKMAEQQLEEFFTDQQRKAAEARAEADRKLNKEKQQRQNQIQEVSNLLGTECDILALKEESK